MWNVESEVDIPHEAYPWKVLPREKKSGAKLPAELPKAAWDILEQHAEDQEEGITASLRNGHRCQEMPDVGAPYTYIYSADGSAAGVGCLRTLRPQKGLSTRREDVSA